MTTRARTASIIAAGALLLAIPACGSSSDDGGSKATTTTAKPKDTGTAESSASTGTKIVIKDFDFAPKTLEAKAGTVTVENQDGTNHSVTADDGAFDTGKFASGTKQIDITKPGTYTYHCEVHSFMTGTLVVTAK